MKVVVPVCFKAVFYVCLCVQEWRDGLPALSDCDPGNLQSYSFQSDSPQGSITLGHTQVGQIARFWSDFEYFFFRMYLNVL